MVWKRNVVSLLWCFVLGCFEINDHAEYCMLWFHLWNLTAWMIRDVMQYVVPFAGPPEDRGFLFIYWGMEELWKNLYFFLSLPFFILFLPPIFSHTSHTIYLKIPVKTSHQFQSFWRLGRTLLCFIVLIGKAFI